MKVLSISDVVGIAYIIGTLEDGREVQAELRDGKIIVIGVACGKTSTPEGTKTLWNQLEQQQRFEVSLYAIDPHKS